jgi:hypothetical protein
MECEKEQSFPVIHCRFEEKNRIIGEMDKKKVLFRVTVTLSQEGNLN